MEPLQVSSSPMRPSHIVAQDLRVAQENARAGAALVANLTDRRPGLLIDGTDEDLDALDEEIHRAHRQTERSTALSSRLEAQLADAETAERETQRQAAYDAAIETSAKAQASARTAYLSVIRKVREAIRVLAEAGIVVDQVNGNLPVGQPALPDPEAALRGDPGTLRREVKRERVTLFVLAGSGQPYSPELQESIRRNLAAPRRAGETDEEYAERRQPPTSADFDRVEYVAARWPELPDRLADVVNLPALRPADEGPGWTPLGHSTTAAALAAAMTEAPSPQLAPEKREIEYLPVGTFEAKPSKNTVVKTARIGGGGPR